VNEKRFFEQNEWVPITFVNKQLEAIVSDTG